MGEDTDHDLSGHENGDQGERDAETPRVRLRADGMAVVVPVVVAHRGKYRPLRFIEWPLIRSTRCSAKVGG
jgi:hypothetical protein